MSSTQNNIDFFRLEDALEMFLKDPCPAASMNLASAASSLLEDYYLNDPNITPAYYNRLAERYGFSTRKCEICNENLEIFPFGDQYITAERTDPDDSSVIISYDYYEGFDSLDFIFNPDINPLVPFAIVSPKLPLSQNEHQHNKEGIQRVKDLVEKEKIKNEQIKKNLKRSFPDDNDYYYVKSELSRLREAVVNYLYRSAKTEEERAIIEDPFLNTGPSNAFENDTFKVVPYDWNPQEIIKEDGEIEIIAEPNFTYKPQEIIIDWYKHYGRGLHAQNDETLSVVENRTFDKIIDACIDSLVFEDGTSIHDYPLYDIENLEIVY